MVIHIPSFQFSQLPLYSRPMDLPLHLHLLPLRFIIVTLFISQVYLSIYPLHFFFFFRFSFSVRFSRCLFTFVSLFLCFLPFVCLALCLSVSFVSVRMCLSRSVSGCVFRSVCPCLSISCLSFFIC